MFNPKPHHISALKFTSTTASSASRRLLGETVAKPREFSSTARFAPQRRGLHTKSSRLRAQHLIHDSAPHTPLGASFAGTGLVLGIVTIGAFSFYHRQHLYSSMSSKLIPQNPSDVMVIREISPNVTTLSVPFSRFGTIKIGGRATIVRLSSGELAVFSPVALTPEVREKLPQLGSTVRYIIAPDMEHHIFISEWVKAFPEARIIGPAGLPEKRAKQNDEKVGKEEFFKVFEASKKRETTIAPDFDADFEYEFVDAHPNKELVFFYKPEKILIQADLMFNLPATEQYSKVSEAERQKSGFADRLFQSLQNTEGEAKGTKRMLWYLMSRSDRPGFNDSVQRINKWDFETIIPCHGETMIGNGKQLFEKIFEWHLQGHNFSTSTIFTDAIHPTIPNQLSLLARKTGLEDYMSLKACRIQSLRPSRRLIFFTWSSETQHRAPVRLASSTTSNHFITESPTTRATTTQPDAADDAQAAEDGFPPFTLAVKDNIATLNEPTTCASAGLLNYTSPFEATVVTQLRRRGAALVGKTNLDEFGMGSHSANSAVPSPGRPVAGFPDPQRSPGGSSGGSAVAVARGDADVALGTDTGGSVRLPAAYTGVVGFKPSYGMISRFGVVPYANSLDTVGLLAREVGPVARLLVRGGMWRENDPNDPTSLSESTRRRCAAVREGYNATGATSESGAAVASFKHLTFGVPLEYNIEELSPSVKEAWQTTLDRLRRLGARVVPVSLPTTRHALSAYYVIAPAEASSNLAKYDGVRYGERDPSGAADGAGDVLYSAARGAGFGDEVKRRILLGSYTLSSEAIDNYFIQAQKVRRLVRRDFDRVFRLGNPLLDGGEEEEGRQQFDLTDLPEGVALDDKRGPPQVDFLVCPTAPTPPPAADEVKRATPLDAYMNDVFTVPASLAGLPAISIPMPGKDSGLPIGMQLIGQFWDDARLLGTAETLVQAMEG